MQTKIKANKFSGITNLQSGVLKEFSNKRNSKLMKKLELKKTQTRTRRLDQPESLLSTSNCQSRNSLYAHSKLKTKQTKISCVKRRLDSDCGNENLEKHYKQVKKVVCSDITPDSDKVTFCICKGKDDGVRPMLQCDMCKDWYHFDCVDISEENVPDIYSCPICDIKKTRSITETGISPLDLLIIAANPNCEQQLVSLGTDQLKL